jgi:hypothetical protein
VNKKRPQELPAALAISLHFRLVVPAWINQFKPPPEIAIDHISIFCVVSGDKNIKSTICKRKNLNLYKILKTVKHVTII